MNRATAQEMIHQAFALREERLPLALCWGIWIAASAALWALLLCAIFH